MKNRPTKPQDEIQRQFEEMGLGTEAERQRHRGETRTPNHKEDGYYVLQWFTDERDLALSEMQERMNRA